MKKLLFLGVNILTVYLLFGLANDSLAILPGVLKTSPTDGQMGVSLAPTLTWQKVSGANAYEIIVKNYGGSNVWNVFVADINSKTIPSEKLQTDKTYEWCVRAIKSSRLDLDPAKEYALGEIEYTDMSPNCAPNSSFNEVKAGEYDLFSTTVPEGDLKTPGISSPKGVTTFPLILKWSYPAGSANIAYEWRITGTESSINSRGETVITDLDASALPHGRTKSTQVDADPSYTLSIAKNRAYTWQVRACNLAYSNCGAQWASANFTLTLKSFHLLSPKNDMPTATTVKLDWEDVLGAESYRVVGDFGTSDVAKSEKIVSGLALDTTYTWYVIAKRNGIDFLSIEQNWSFTPRSGVAPPTSLPGTDSALPAPQLSSPTDGQENVSLTPTFSWKSVTGANLYQIEVKGFPIVIKILYNSIDPSRYSEFWPEFKPGGIYQWRVSASKDGGANWSDWSDPRTFTTKGTPPAGSPADPNNLSPCGGKTGVSIVPTLSWNKITGATYYNVFIPPFLYFQNDSTSVKIHEENVGISLEPGQTYYWWVQACNDAGCSAGKKICEFTTAEDAASGGKSGGGGGSIFPSLDASCNQPTECAEGQICNPLKYRSVECLVGSITNFLIRLSVPVAVVMFLIAGIMFVISSGDPEKIRTAKRIMIYTAVGFAVILVASGLIKVLQSLIGG